MGEPLRNEGVRRDHAELERRDSAAYKALAEYRLWRGCEQTSAEAELWDELRLAEAVARHEADPGCDLLARVEARERTLTRLRDLSGPPQLRHFNPEEIRKLTSVSKETEVGSAET